MDEYTASYRSLMRWLRDSIAGMERGQVPNNAEELERSLRSLRLFRLDAYAKRLRDKKKLTQKLGEILVEYY